MNFQLSHAHGLRTFCAVQRIRKFALIALLEKNIMITSYYANVIIDFLMCV